MWFTRIHPLQLTYQVLGLYILLQVPLGLWVDFLSFFPHLLPSRCYNSFMVKLEKRSVSSNIRRVSMVLWNKKKPNKTKQKNPQTHTQNTKKPSHKTNKKPPAKILMLFEKNKEEMGIEYFLFFGEKNEIRLILFLWSFCLLVLSFLVSFNRNGLKIWCD